MRSRPRFNLAMPGTKGHQSHHDPSSQHSEQTSVLSKLSMFGKNRSDIIMEGSFWQRRTEVEDNFFENAFGCIYHLS